MGKTIWAIVILAIIGLLGITYAQIEQTKSLLGSLESQVAANANKVVAAITPTPTLKPAVYLLPDFGLKLPLDPDQIQVIKSTNDYKEYEYQQSIKDAPQTLRFFKVKSTLVNSSSKLKNWFQETLKSDPAIFHCTNGENCKPYPAKVLQYTDYLPFVSPLVGQSCGFETKVVLNVAPPKSELDNPLVDSYYIVFPLDDDFSIIFNSVEESSGGPGCPRVLPLPLQS